MDEFISGVIVSIIACLVLFGFMFTDIQYEYTMRQIKPYAYEKLHCDSDMNKMQPEQFKFCEYYKEKGVNR